ncbi:MAG: ABC transporter ATP-binding protein [Cellulosilyticum sp.]|nr:ABC transporter ATP-binding protein [Cellulosilyticum sp.]
MLQIKGLEKAYGNFKALNGLDLEIKKGEIFGFIGPNGAGKSTTMKIVSGLLTADSGEAYVAGIDALKNHKKVKEKIGYMPDFFGTYTNLKAIEYLEFFASTYGILGSEAKKLGMDLLELVNLQDKYDAEVDGLSRGMKQRLCLARCLIHNPDFLILDEPASGMDPRARFEMKGILKNLRDMDKTVLVSSHILPELGEICTQIGVINGGKMLYSGTVDEVMEQFSGNAPLKISVLDACDKAMMILKEQPSVTKVRATENQIHCSYQGDNYEITRLLKILVQNDIPVIGLDKEVANLEDVFMKITETTDGEAI